jgi:hypothetical protein
MRRVAAAGRPVRVTDIAAGHGRYVLDAVTGSDVKPQAVVLRDYSDINVRDGRALIRGRACRAWPASRRADAFDRASLAGRVTRNPPSAWSRACTSCSTTTTMVGRSLQGLADAIPPGGYLVYTGQPWHPQLELIARALTSHRQGQAWVMRRRTRPRWTSWWMPRASQAGAAHRRVGHLQRQPGAAGGVKLDRPGRVPDRPWRRALAWLALLAPFFYASYGLANHLALRTWRGAQRGVRLGALRSRSGTGRSFRTGASTRSTACRCCWRAAGTNWTATRCGC